MLESIPGKIISKAAAMLPDAKSAPDEPHNVAMPYNGRRILITVRWFECTRGKTTLWFWTATGAAPLEKIMERDETLTKYFWGWQPTPEAINALAQAAAPLHPWTRKMADPAGLLRENTVDHPLHNLYVITSPQRKVRLVAGLRSTARVIVTRV